MRGIILGFWLYIVNLFAFIDDSGFVDTLKHLFALECIFSTVTYLKLR